MPPIRRLVLLLTLCAPGACATGGAAFSPTGYEQTGFHYKIAYAGKTQNLVGADWQLDNLVWNAEGSRWDKKAGPDYIATREQDLDGNGTIGAGESNEEVVYDLRYVHRRDQGVIWTKAHPLLLKNAAQDLDVILETYADQLSGEGLYAAATISLTETVKTRKFVSFIVERAPIQVGPNLGVVATIELAEVERLRLDPTHRSARLKIVLSKLTYQNPAEDSAYRSRVPGGQQQRVPCGTSSCDQGIGLLVAGYYNDASHFAEHAGEFDDLIRRLSIPPEGVLPAHLRSRPVKTAAASPAPPPPAVASPPSPPTVP